MGKKSVPKKILAVIDLETDPFKAGRLPLPFVAGYYDGDHYAQFWGDDCIAELLDYLGTLSPRLIYAHNGGKFDYWYLSHAITAPVKFIGARLVKGRLGQHELRDSFKIIPVPLRDYEKELIDYAFMERGQREAHRAQISAYLRSDCVHLYDMVAAFREEFGDVLTIGGAAMKEITKRYKLPTLRAKDDAVLRPYFHGGRCEAFEIGAIKARRGKFKMIDLNSAYPDRMANCDHPIGLATASLSHLPAYGFYLATVDATSRGALPFSTKDGLTFPHAREIYHVTSHELRAALELGLVEIHNVLRCLVWHNTTRFDQFVEFFAAKKIAAERENDKAGRLFAKLLMNNAFGKFAQNPARFRDFELFTSNACCLKAGYEPAGLFGSHVLGQRSPDPVTIRHGFHNVATAASITGAVRAVLLRALAGARRPIYCDTDSLVCETPGSDIALHDTQLGSWKLEWECSTFYCAAKKLYAAHDGERFVKWACKGAPVTPETIARIAQGERYIAHIDAPSLRVGKESKFITRTLVRKRIVR